MDNVLGTRPPLHTEMDTNPEKERHIQLLYEQVIEHYNRIGTPEGLEKLKEDMNIEDMDWDDMTPEQQQEFIDAVLANLPEVTESEIDSLFPEEPQDNSNH